jgi:hypothetical protein
MKLKLLNDDVKILEEKPPVYDNVCAFLGYNDINAFFTYGDTIYNPARLEIPNDIIIHERVHMKQQTRDGMTPELWWGKYLRDEKFRIDQEAKAYGAQLRSIKNVHKDRNYQTRILISLASSLSGPLYKNAIGHTEAMLLISKYSN